MLPVHDVVETKRALEGWLGRRAELPSMSVNASALWAENYSRQKLLPRWVELLARVSGQNSIQVVDAP